MSDDKPDRPQLWQMLKEAGWTPPPSRTYASYKLEELELEWNTEVAKQIIAKDFTDENGGVPEASVTEQIVTPEEQAVVDQQSAETAEAAAAFEAAFGVPPTQVPTSAPGPGT